MDEFAVILIFHVNDSPTILAAPNLFTIDKDRTVRTDNSEGDHTLVTLAFNRGLKSKPHHDVLVQFDLFFIMFVGVEWVEANIMIFKFSSNLEMRQPTIEVSVKDGRPWL